MNLIFRMQIKIALVVTTFLTGCGGESGEGSGAGGQSYSEVEKIWSRECNVESSERFKYDESTNLIDTLTCLEWLYIPMEYKPYITQENYEKGRYDDTSGNTAQSICKELGEGWRLPTQYEVLSAIIDPKADLSKIPYRGKIPDEIYKRGNFFTGATWTTTPVAGHEQYRWFVEFMPDGAKKDSNRVNLNSFQVFCVREVD